jgi:O-antigen/teichoic acid export membrane protein
VAGLASGLGLVTLYKLGVELANKMRQIPNLLVSALVPAASDLDARDEQDQLRRLYVLSTKYVGAVAVPLVAFTVATAGILMRTWMGDAQPVSAWVLRIIALGYAANVLPGAGVSIALGKGRADLQMKAGLIATGANIALTVALVLTVGFWGIPIATAVSMVLAFAWFVGAARSVIGVGPGELLRDAVLWPTLASVPGFVACVCADMLTADVSGSAANGGILLASAAVFGAMYLGLIRLVPFLTAFDIEFLGDTLHLARVPGFRLWTRRVMRDKQDV